MPSPEAADGVAEFAPAKVNLCLHVTGRRDDGYHLLDSLVAFIDLGDTVSAAPSGMFRLDCGGPFGGRVPAGEDNLVLRAARAFAAPGKAVALRLTKRLPPASGIGGGSADAAAAVRAVLRLAGSDPRAADPARLLALGADVPVCLAARPARMTGVGERLGAAPPLPRGWLVLANPGVELSTPRVFAALSRRDNPPVADPPARFPDTAALAAWLADARNDLEAPALSLAPAIGVAKAALAAQPGCLLARMSGSGATVFGLFGSGSAARAASAALSAAQPGWWVAAAALLTGEDDRS